MKSNKDKLIIISLVILLVVIITFFIITKLINNKNNNKEYEIDNSTDIQYELKNNGANEYRIMNVDNEFIVNNYFKYIKNLIINNQDEAYSLLTDESKNIYKTKEDYVKYINSIISDDFLDRKVSKYNIDGNGIRTITIIDEANYKYIIYEDGIWNIKYSIIGMISLN